MAKLLYKYDNYCRSQLESEQVMFTPLQLVHGLVLTFTKSLKTFNSYNSILSLHQSVNVVDGKTDENSKYRRNINISVVLIHICLFIDSVITQN